MLFVVLHYLLNVCCMLMADKYRIVSNFHAQAVLDHHTYIMDLTEANAKDKPEWTLEYSAKVYLIIVILSFSLCAHLLNQRLIQTHI